MALVFICLLSTVALVGAALAGLLVDQRRVAAAADLAALAGAGAVQEGREACSAAGVVATRNGAAMTNCQLVGANLTVEVAKRASTVFGRTITLRAAARAGPDGGWS